MFFVSIKLVNSDFGPYICFFIQIFPKVLVLIPTVSLFPLSDDMDDGESHTLLMWQLKYDISLYDFGFSP